MLMMPDKTTSVTSVAFDCGFTNLGHFAKDRSVLLRRLTRRVRDRSSFRKFIFDEGAQFYGPGQASY
jgi:transcriptional regulator GlxA family with amidase domain